MDVSADMTNSDITDIKHPAEIGKVEQIVNELSPMTVDKLKQFADLLLQKNTKINLTSLKEPKLFWIKNVLDSLSPYLYPEVVEKYFTGDLLDLGTGGGFPLLPLAIVSQTESLDCLGCLRSFTGVDSVNKKLMAVKDVAAEIGVENLHFIHGRAEDLGHSKYREQYSTVVSRAVAPLNVLLELISPFLKVGGFAVLYKGPGYLDEIDAARAIFSRLGLRFIETREYILPEGEGERALLIFGKVAALGSHYPRGANVLRKSPLK